MLWHSMQAGYVLRTLLANCLADTGMLLTIHTHSANIPPMLAIRLKRVGRTNDPSFRIIVQDHRRSPKKTRGLVEYVGSYDARKGTPQINGERVKYWMSQGARPSATVHNLLIDAKVVTGKKVNAMNKKTKVVSNPAPSKVEGAVSKAAEDAPKKESPSASAVTAPDGGVDAQAAETPEEST